MDSNPALTRQVWGLWRRIFDQNSGSDMSIHFGRSLRSLFCTPPRLPRVSGRVLVFGSAPSPHVSSELVSMATIVTANASQLTLERYGVACPHITFMRPNMWDDRATSKMKREALGDRRTGLLAVEAPKDDPKCDRLLAALREVNYRFDELLILDRLESCVVQTRMLHPRSSSLVRKYDLSMGLRAILTCLAMGADELAVSGISLKSDGCSFSDLSYQRKHKEADRQILNRIRHLGLPVFPADRELAAESGLSPWQPHQEARSAVT